MQLFLYQFCCCKHFKWPSISQVLFYSPPLERFCWPESNISNHYAKQNLYLRNILLGRRSKQRPYLNHLGKKLAIAFVTPSLAAIVCWRVLRGA